MQYKVVSPIKINLGGKTTFPLNLNIYRNAHHYKLNLAKQNYSKLMSYEVNKLPKFETLTLKYILYLSSKRKVDLMNICSVVDKFFCDVLQKEGIIEDDNCYVLSETTYSFGGIDKKNPRVEIFLEGEISAIK